MRRMIQKIYVCRTQQVCVRGRLPFAGDPAGRNAVHSHQPVHAAQRRLRPQPRQHLPLSGMPVSTPTMMQSPITYPHIHTSQGPNRIRCGCAEGYESPSGKGGDCVNVK